MSLSASLSFSEVVALKTLKNKAKSRDNVAGQVLEQCSEEEILLENVPDGATGLKIFQFCIT